MRRALTHELAFFFLFSHSLDQSAGFLIEPSTIPWQRVGVRFWVSAAAYQQTEAFKPGSPGDKEEDARDDGSVVQLVVP